MKPLFTELEYNIAKSRDKLPCQCYVCKRTFFKLKSVIYAIRNGLSGHNGKYCSRICLSKDTTQKEQINCLNCNLGFYRTISQNNKSKKQFCSKSCAATYNNKHKTYGTRRSKLEVWLEKQLPSLYPSTEFHFNRKDAIGSELDIYIPSLRLAFELNGIFHYEPIFGSDKLGQIQSNDFSKSKACIDHQIDLCIIDVSRFKNFKPLKAQEYLNIISNIIKQRTN